MGVNIEIAGWGYAGAAKIALDGNEALLRSLVGREKLFPAIEGKPIREFGVRELLPISAVRYLTEALNVPATRAVNWVRHLRLYDAFLRGGHEIVSPDQEHSWSYGHYPVEIVIHPDRLWERIRERCHEDYPLEVEALEDALIKTRAGEVLDVTLDAYARDFWAKRKSSS